MILQIDMATMEVRDPAIGVVGKVIRFDGAINEAPRFTIEVDNAFYDKGKLDKRRPIF